MSPIGARWLPVLAHDRDPAGASSFPWRAELPDHLHGGEGSNIGLLSLACEALYSRGDVGLVAARAADTRDWSGLWGVETGSRTYGGWAVYSAEIVRQRLVDAGRDHEAELLRSRLASYIALIALCTIRGYAREMTQGDVDCAPGVLRSTGGYYDTRAPVASSLCGARAYDLIYPGHTWRHGIHAVMAAVLGLHWRPAANEGCWYDAIWHLVSRDAFGLSSEERAAVSSLYGGLDGPEVLRVLMEMLSRHPHSWRIVGRRGVLAAECIHEHVPATSTPGVVYAAVMRLGAGDSLLADQVIVAHDVGWRDSGGEHDWVTPARAEIAIDKVVVRSETRPGEIVVERIPCSANQVEWETGPNGAMVTKFGDEIVRKEKDDEPRPQVSPRKMPRVRGKKKGRRPILERILSWLFHGWH